MNEKMKTLLTFVLAVVMMASMIGCNSKTSEEISSTDTPSTKTSSTELSLADAKAYPLDTDVSLTWWVNFAPIQGFGEIKSMNDTPFAKQLIKETGVNIEFLHPSGNDQTAALNLLIASGDLPDIIEYDWYLFPGGPEAPINNGTILKLNELIDGYAPNLKAYLEANSDLEKDVKTDEGSYYVFPFLRDNKELTVYHGPIIRQDLLDKLGLQMPATIDEYENILLEFKKNGIDAPFTFDWGAIEWDHAFVGAYNAKFGTFVEDGEIKFGQAQPGYKEFLTLFKNWYDQGLLDKNFATLTGEQKDTAMTSGTSALTLGLAGGNIGSYSKNAENSGNGFLFAPAPYPVLKKGDIAKFGQIDNRYTTYNAAAITTSCKNPEVAARLLDYGYSPEGILLYNFGIKDVSYQIIDGIPTYTDIVTNDPQGRSFGSVNATFARTGGSPTIQQLDYLYQYLALPQQREAVRIWSNTDAEKYMVPKISLTPEESSDAASILNTINTYVDEMTFKFILGVEPLSDFDEYLNQLDKLGLQEYLKYNQDALDRYKNR